MCGIIGLLVRTQLSAYLQFSLTFSLVHDTAAERGRKKKGAGSYRSDLHSTANIRDDRFQARGRWKGSISLVVAGVIAGEEQVDGVPFGEDGRRSHAGSGLWMARAPPLTTTF